MTPDRAAVFPREVYTRRWEIMFAFLALLASEGVQVVDTPGLEADLGVLCAVLGVPAGLALCAYGALTLSAPSDAPSHRLEAGLPPLLAGLVVAGLGVLACLGAMSAQDEQRAAYDAAIADAGFERLGDDVIAQGDGVEARLTRRVETSGSGSDESTTYHLDGGAGPVPAGLRLRTRGWVEFGDERPTGDPVFEHLLRNEGDVPAYEGRVCLRGLAEHAERLEVHDGRLDVRWAWQEDGRVVVDLARQLLACAATLNAGV